MNILRTVLASMLFLLAPSMVLAEPLKMGQNETITSALKKQAGKRVTLQLVSATQLTGTVGMVNNSVVHLGALAGKEYFDAVVEISDIEAVIIRVK